MQTILNLFGRSPFAPLQAHMDKVSSCVDLLNALFLAVTIEDSPAVVSQAQEITARKAQADLMKNAIRNHLPKGIFLAIDRTQLLEIISIQGQLADQTEEIAFHSQLSPKKLPNGLQEPFFTFLNKNIDSFNAVKNVMNELHDLLESSFGGSEAEKVSTMIIGVAQHSQEARQLHLALLKDFLSKEGELTRPDFYIWTRLFTYIAALSTLSDKLAHRMRMTLDLP